MKSCLGEFSGIHILTLMSIFPPGEGKCTFGASKHSPSVTDTSFVSSGQNSENVLMTLHVLRTTVPGFAVIRSSFDSSNCESSILVIRSSSSSVICFWTIDCLIELNIPFIKDWPSSYLSLFPFKRIHSTGSVTFLAFNFLIAKY